MRESKVERDTCDLAFKNLGIKSSKMKMIEAGFPDRIFWIPGGKPLMIEFKAPGEVPRHKQLDIHSNLRSLGYKIEVHTNAIDAIKSIIRAVEATGLYEKSNPILVRARRFCAVPRPRAGKDVDHTGRDKDTQNKKAPR